MAESGRPPRVVRLLYYLGFLLLFSSLGTVGSAVFLAHRATAWTPAVAQVQDCSLEEYGPQGGERSALGCEIAYRLAGQTYSTSFLTRFTSSPRERLAIIDWISHSRSGVTLNLRVNPSYPSEIIVQSPLPVGQGDDPNDFVHAAGVLGVGGLVFLVSAGVIMRRREA
jgi:hypothetical protein